ncbi:YncE family protein [Flavobacterium sp. Sr18]|uniref:YncE family protein n=1 Tax=Flavobacterium sp. Sr18 TaxID=935222 RepID=UPI001F49F78B|nr:YncE family protein [Flavobacterium sp. Sr18]
MKYIFYTASILRVMLLSSFNKDDNMDMTNPASNVNYPAAYVVTGEDATISVIKLSTNEVTGTIPLMGTGKDMIMWPHHISSHSNHLAIGVPGMDLSVGHAVTGTMSGKLVVIDATTGSIVKNIGLTVMNHNTIYSPNGTEIWVPQMDMKGKVLVYDATTYALKSTITAGMMPAELTFFSDGTKAYVAHGDDDNVSVINVASKSVVATVTVGNNPVGAWTASDDTMYVDNEDGQSISVISVATNAVDQTIPLGFMPGIASHNGIKSELWVSGPNGRKGTLLDLGYYNYDVDARRRF